MEDKKEQIPRLQKMSEAFLEGTLFLLFGSKNWQKGKRQIPPVYILAGIIIFLLIIFVVKKIHSKPKPIYPLPGYEFQYPLRREAAPPGGPNPFPPRRGY